jgi:FkbM family methyltransferase
MTISEYIVNFGINFNYYDNTYENVPIKILKYLQNIDKGVFVEIGAHNGIFQSNTKILEDCGWKGLLIEPSSKLFEDCKINRKCFVERYALVSDDYTEQFIDSDNTGENLRNNAGVFSMGPESSEKCPAISFNKLNKKYMFKNIDFMSIDVEGYELEVIKGIDLEKISIQFLVIEINNRFYSLEDMNQFLFSKGYSEPINISNFTKLNCPTWPGTHQDYLYIKKWNT